MIKWLGNKSKTYGQWLSGAGIILVIALPVAIITYLASDVSSEEYWKGFAIEAGGTTYDVFLIVLLLGGYEVYRQKKRGIREKIAELRRKINDVKKLDNKYAHAIIGASLRELAKFEVTDIDFKGIKLSNFKFNSHDNGHDIASIKGSVFSDSFCIKSPSKNSTRLTSVDFTNVDCSDVIFGKSNIPLGVYKNCTFQDAKLCNTSFYGVTLEWDKNNVIANEKNWYDTVEETDGTSSSCRIYSPAFYGADLHGAIFDEAQISYADFRSAQNIEHASFKNVRGIETCFFDDEVLEQLRLSGKLTEHRDNGGST